MNIEENLVSLGIKNYVFFLINLKLHINYRNIYIMLTVSEKCIKNIDIFFELIS